MGSCKLRTIERGIFALIVLTGGCRGNPDGSLFKPPPEPTPPASQAIGGIWQGTDSNADALLAFTTEKGKFQLIKDNGAQGHGTATANGTMVSIDYTLVPPYGKLLVDGSTFSVCHSHGIIAQRQLMNLSTDCTTELDTSTSATVLLSYNLLYERDSSLETIAGMYNDAAQILTVDSNGVLFEQNSITGCVLNGQLSVINSEFNLYDIEFDLADCTGLSDVFNGSTFAGLATLDDTGNPEALIASTIGEVDDMDVARVIDAGSLGP